ncbi:PTS N-acetylglucosamine transporter subunit IIBC [Ruoffia tabacinasalis]|uniref:PTS N-acetylglucosamine transporter subunit IIBC n=1 Tax=Ruoffia tabacinasalis TaxID=87458 RepID=A0A5R9DV82_9LACT|nr:PTS N-acetylglucosamine transporter subunit IIBC [Ruoffia tabacinasalis]TLQ39870.1 PTS N-acetylglucosamine transporter subunit IIBC [Ruoffia tabacinasalis]
MKKIIIATHHKLAEGFKSTLEYIVPNTVEVIDINAYIDNISVEDQITEELNKFNDDEQIFVFTDLLGGSVNQEFAKKISKYNIELISGVNLPLIMTIVLAFNDRELTKETIRGSIEEAQKQIVYVNDFIKDQQIDDEDE